MKLKYLSAEFLLIFVFLALPPLFVGPSASIPAAPRLSWAGVEALVIAILLSIQLRKELGRSRCHPLRAISIATVTFGMLMLAYALVGLGSFAAARLLGTEGPEAGARAVEGWLPWLQATAALASGAFSEETLYRAFLPEIPLLLLSRTGNGFLSRHRRQAAAAVEALCVLVFAFSHRYLGAAAVANAILCGTVLRTCYRKSGGVLCGTAAHFCYNMTLLLFASLA